MQILQEIIFKIGRQSEGNPTKAVKTGFLWEGKEWIEEVWLLGKLEEVRELSNNHTII